MLYVIFYISYCIISFKISINAYIDSVGFALYLTVFLLYLYTYLSGGLLAGVKGNVASFAADYSLELNFSKAYV